MTRARLAAAAPAALPAAAGVTLAVGLALAPLAGRAGPVLLIGAVAVVLYVAALALPWPGVLVWAVGLLGVEYLVSLELRAAPLDLAAPAHAAAWFLCAELGWLGLEARRGDRLWAGRALAIALLALAGSALGAVLLLAPAVPLGGGAPVTAVGVAAAVAAAACLAWLGRR
jgi:hypothetical protein